MNTVGNHGNLLGSQAIMPYSFFGPYDGEPLSDLNIAPQSDATLGNVVTAYLAFSQDMLKSVQLRQSVLKKFTARWGKRRMVDITIDDLQAYRKERQKTIKNSTVNMEVHILSAVFNYAYRSGRIDKPHNPCLQLRALPEKLIEPVELTDDDLIKLCRASWPSVKRFLLIARYTGLRHQAILDLQWSQIRDGVIYPPGEITSKRVGRVPIRKELEGVFGKPGAGHVLTKSNGQPYTAHIFVHETALKALGRSIRIHDLRYAFHSDLLRAGVPDAVRRILMGHGRDLAFSRSLADRYVSISDTDLRKFMERLPNAYEVIARCLH